MFNRPWLSDHSTTPDEAIEAALSPIEEDDEQLRQLKLEEVSWHPACLEKTCYQGVAVVVCAWCRANQAVDDGCNEIMGVVAGTAETQPIYLYEADPEW